MTERSPRAAVGLMKQTENKVLQLDIRMPERVGVVKAEKTCAVDRLSLESFPLTQKKRSARAGWLASVARPAVGPERFRKKGDHV